MKLKMLGDKEGVLYVEATCECGQKHVIGIKPIGVGFNVIGFKDRQPQSSINVSTTLRPRQVA